MTLKSKTSLSKKDRVPSSKLKRKVATQKKIVAAYRPKVISYNI